MAYLKNVVTNKYVAIIEYEKGIHKYLSYVMISNKKSACNEFREIDLENFKCRYGSKNWVLIDD